MKLAILTTETPHHVYFLREIASRFQVARVYAETANLSAPFETFHPFEIARNEYERALWFGGQQPRLSDLASTEVVASMNDPSSVASLAELAPNIVLVFGTGRLKQPVLAVQPSLTLNLHGGDPENYRGLDSHLWAIYHRDFRALIATLHFVTPELDDGDIAGQMQVPLAPGMALHQLRVANTEACVKLAISALNAVRSHGAVASRRQKRRGRYYSFMPAPLKELCSRRFASYTGRLCVPEGNDAEPC
jgi:methionyl-tRNA formyltransferase